MSKILVLSSGRGGNFRFLLEARSQGLLSTGTDIAIFTDRDCGARELGKSYVVESFQPKSGEPLAECLLEAYEKFQPDFVVTNIHKILPQRVIRFGEAKFLNLHYSLLPAFAGEIGDKPVSMAMRYGARILGTTVHEVSEEVDMGRPIAQAAFPISESDFLETVMEVQFRLGCLMLLDCIQSPNRSYAKTAAHEILGRPVIFSSIYTLPKLLLEESFWGH